MESGPIICSYQFAKAKAKDIKEIEWDLVVLDEAHRLRNVYKTSNVIAKTLKDAMAHVHSKVLLTATPLQNSLVELYGLVSIIDDRVFGDLDSFRAQFTSSGRDQAFGALRERLATVCKRTLRKQVQPYVSYTARKAIVQEFTPSNEEQELSRLVADYLRRPNLQGAAAKPAATDLPRPVEAAGVQHARHCGRAGNDGQAPARRARCIAGGRSDGGAGRRLRVAG
jgi:hypothetical protein